jgi:nitrous oxide reductase
MQVNFLEEMKMDTKKQEVEQTARRDFLKLTALGAAAGTVAAGSAAHASEVEPVSNGDYQETQHVKTYYELARF